MSKLMWKKRVEDDDRLEGMLIEVKRSRQGHTSILLVILYSIYAGTELSMQAKKAEQLLSRTVSLRS